MNYSTGKLSVKDSFEDEDGSEDVEDEVFIRDGKKGFRLDEEIGVKRPLMAPRRKFKYSQLYHERSNRSFHRRFCSYRISFLSVFLSICVIIVILLCVFPNPIDRFRHWKMIARKFPEVIPCTQFKSEHIWHETFPFLKSESVMTTYHADGDSVLDIAIGFATEVEDAGEMEGEGCGLYAAPTGRCGGGVMVLEGRTGKPLWKYWARGEVLYLDCSQSVNSEPTTDCLISGRSGVLCILDGKTGFVIWEFSKSALHHRLDLYTAQYVFDLNDDGVADVLISHTSDESSHLLVLNGRTGGEIGQVESPRRRPIFSPPRVLHTRNNSYQVLFGTGQLDSPGALHLVSLDSVALSEGSKISLLWEGGSGVASDLLLVDLDSDSSPDLVFSAGRSLHALSGTDFSSLWNYTSAQSSAQILVDPTPGYWDDDPHPDLLVTELVGPDYPAYYSKSVVLSGKTGERILSDEEGLTGEGELMAPGLTLSFTAPGNDMFLYWTSTCGVSPAAQRQPFQFSQGSESEEKAHSDLCQLRFNSSLESRLYLLSQHLEPPGVLIYSSKNEWEIEHNNSVGGYFSTHQGGAARTGSSFRRRGGLFSTSSDEKRGRYGGSRWEPPRVAYDGPPLSGEGGDSYYPEEEGIGIPLGQDGGGGMAQYDAQQLGVSQQQLGVSPQQLRLPSQQLGVSQQLRASPQQLRVSPQQLRLSPQQLRVPPVDEGRDERADYTREMMKRQVSTSTLAQQPSILPRALASGVMVNSINGSGVDVVFATYWELASSKVRIFTEKELKCIEQRVQAEKNSNSLDLLDSELSRESAENACSGRGEAWQPQQSASGGLRGAPAGQLTIFRISISGWCSDLREGEVCSRLLPYEEQSFPRRASSDLFRSRAFPPSSVYSLLS